MDQVDAAGVGGQRQPVDRPGLAVDVQKVGLGV
jgi:hypothetical protein